MTQNFNIESLVRKIFPKTIWPAQMDKIDEKVRSRVIQSIESLFTDNPVGLLIVGPPGVGKTCILKVIFETYLVSFAKKHKWAEGVDEWEIWRESNLRFITDWELSKNLRNNAADPNEYALKPFKDKILMVDDLGRSYEDKAGWNLSLYDEYLDFRQSNLLPTYFTCNYSVQKLRSWVGWERIVDRMSDSRWMRTITISGKSRRK